MQKSSIPWSARKAFYEVAITQVDNGRPLTAVIEEFRDRLVRRGRKKLAAEFNSVAARMRDGKSFAEAMGSSLEDSERSMLSTGEASGRITQSMRFTLEVSERVARVRRKLMGAMFGPAVYLLTLYAVLLIIALKVVPSFASILPPSRWIGWGAGMYDMSRIAVSPASGIVALIIIATFGVAVWSLPRWDGPVRIWLDKAIPPYSIYRELTGLTWLLSFTALLATGVPETKALSDSARQSKAWLANRLMLIQRGLRNGADLSAAMRRAGTGFPSADLIDEISAYAAFPDFAAKVNLVAQQYSEKLEKRMTATSTLVGAVFTGLMFMAFAVIQLGANTISSQLSSMMGRV